MAGANNDRPGGGVEPRQRSQELQKPRCAGNSAREFEDEYRSTKAGVVAAAAVARPAFSSFSGPVKTKPPPVERKLECTLEELCRGSKKEIKFTRNVITNKGYILRSFSLISIFFLVISRVIKTEIGKWKLCRIATIRSC